MPSQSSTLHRTPRSSTSVRRRSSWHHSWPLQTITKVGDAWRQEIGHGRATRSHSIFWCDGRHDLAMAPSCKILQCRQNRFDPAWSKLQGVRWLNSIQTSLKAFSQTLLRFQYSTLPGFEYCRRLICFKQEFQQPPLQARRLENWPDGGPPKEASQFGSSHLLGWCKINDHLKYLKQPHLHIQLENPHGLVGLHSPWFGLVFLLQQTVGLRLGKSG